MKIYIIAHTNHATRYIDGAAASFERAEQIAEQVTDGFLMVGYYAPTVQNIIQETRNAGEPYVIRVYKLSNAADDRINVELYAVDEITDN